VVAEPLKNMFGPEVAERIAAMIAAVDHSFPAGDFIRQAQAGFESLELTARARHITRALARHLPPDFEEAVSILVASLGPPIAGDELLGAGMEVFVYLPHVFYVADYGLDHWEASMAAQYEITQRFSCEYSIRAFITRHPERTLVRLQEWAADPKPHVRRLVSEGTRPRLPWAPRLKMFQEDPAPVVELLELLKDDPTTLVRRSVANNLNDIGKDHPGVLVEVCRRWLADAGPEREALVRHALRSAVKRGEPGALQLLGFGNADAATIGEVSITPDPVAIGDKVTIRFTVTNTGHDDASFNVDLKVHFVKAGGRSSGKVFKVRQVDLAPRQGMQLQKVVSLAQHTTRTHYPGDHPVEVVVNGRGVPAGIFRVVT
jgi:3-methyladenine DNA glycosylase AlkC